MLRGFFEIKNGLSNFFHNNVLNKISPGIAEAVMIRHGHPVIKTHDLIALMTHCANIDPDFKDWVDVAAVLTPYATHYRYPCNEPDPDLEETIEAIELASALVVFVQDKLDAVRIDGAEP